MARSAVAKRDDAAAAAAQLTDAETSGVERSRQTAVEVGGKRRVRYFVSFAHRDKKLTDDLLTRLDDFFAGAKNYRFEAWQDKEIELGSDWHKQIQEAINNCDFGLLLVSPAFLASTYIANYELPNFVADDPFRPAARKRVAPVALTPIQFDGTMDLRGLEHRQVFHHQERAYEQLSGNNRKNAFVRQLFVKVIEMLDKHPREPLEEAEHPVVDLSLAAGAKVSINQYFQEQIELGLSAIRFVRTEGQITTQNKLDDPGLTGERRDALEFLREWACDQTGEPYCALLGEYGMGKTTTSMAFAQEMLKARESSSPVPLPIYMDLRNLGEGAKTNPDLLEIIDTVLRKSWRGGFAKIPLPAPEVVRLVQQDGGIAIFDGLDEVLVHLSPAAGQRFTREIFRILPPALFPRRRKQGRPGRVLVTCRTHYFRTSRDQKAYLTAEDRDDLRADDYRVLVLLPFTDQQIRAYLQQMLPDDDIERVLQTIRAVHNLPELAERPYTLSLIARHFPDIERWKMEGRRVTGVDLYRAMVLSWLERDAGKHQITPHHKQNFMEYFAAELWRSGKRAWSVGDVEQWLIDFLRAHPSLAAHYDGKDRELLKEDLRTATFLVREGEADFRFAHTSLQEFFLAGYLYRALIEGRIEDWALPLPSPETLEFLGQLLLGSDESGLAVATLRSIRDAYRAQVSELAFAYVLTAQEKKYPAPSPAGFRLDGADLRQWTIAGPGYVSALNLRGASFRYAQMMGAILRSLDLEGADLSAANLLRAELTDARVRNTIFAQADLRGTLFRKVNFEDTNFAGASLHRTQFLQCRLTGVRCLDAAPPAALFALCEPKARCASVAEEISRLAVFNGHSRSVHGCVFAPDGTRLASASGDNTLRLWDPVSGECLAVLRGHESGVTGCAFAPDGTRLASASQDNTLRLWDPVSGECLAVLRGHESGVTGCAFAPDGTRFASASQDNTLRLWDPVSGECMAVLRGHENSVTGCAFAPDGTRLASASEDHTLRLWDPVSGECQAVLRGHENWVTGCAFAPDGTRLASASWDNTLRLWDPVSGECLTVLPGHESWVMGCAFAPDGTRLASASEDHTLRLWDPVSGECLTVLRGHESWVMGCAFAPDGTRLASASWDNTLRLWDLVSGECLVVLRGQENWVMGCAFAPDGTRLASASEDHTLLLWDPVSGECQAVLRGHESGVMGCAFAPDGTRLASASHDNTLRLWDPVSGECLAVLRGHENWVTGCAFAPDGARLASASEDHTLRLWDPVSGECMAVLRGHEDGVWGCAFTPDGTRLASASQDNTLRLWDPVSGECLAVLRGHESWVMGCAFAPDGTRLASASQRQHAAAVGPSFGRVPGGPARTRKLGHGLRLCAGWSAACLRLLGQHAAAVGPGFGRVPDGLARTRKLGLGLRLRAGWNAPCLRLRGQYAAAMGPKVRTADGSQLAFFQR
jgi:WD40 repeat protein